MSETSHKPDLDFEPTWDVAMLFPAQGHWSEEEYLDLDTNQPVEFSSGYVEILPMPTTFHQRIVAFLYNTLLAFTAAGRLGEVLFAPLRVQLWAGKYREPDLVFMRAENRSRITKDYWIGADLILEVVSDDGDVRRRDLIIKRREYAQAGIPEYWIVDPQLERITVLWLEGTTYSVHGEFPKGTQATSRLLPGFAVDVTAALTAGR
jgi:Uma2 family endonuclease